MLEYDTKVVNNYIVKSYSFLFYDEAKVNAKYSNENAKKRDDIMKGKQSIIITTSIWTIGIMILFHSIFQNLGYARVINYSGIVRGATQKLVKEELNGDQDDETIAYLDDILYDLQHDEGTYDLLLVNNDYYQAQLNDMNVLWNKMKDEISSIRNGGQKDSLYQMSQDYFVMANDMVCTAEEIANQKLIFAIETFFGYLLLSGGIFIAWYMYQRKRLNTIKYTDELTELPNASAFEISMRKYMAGDFEECLLVYVDIDDFKYLNNIYGYPVGNQILTVLAKTIKDLSIKENLCARIGSDNFYVCLKNEEQSIKQLTTAFHQKLKKEMTLDVIDDITMTIGVYFVDGREQLHDILDNVLLAHKSAKKNGKGCIVWYGQELLEKLNKENMIIKQMHHALENEEFKLYLQPKFEIPSLDIIGAEALVRWQMKNGTFLYPDEFIPLFETNGFIHELDLYMLDKTCAFIKQHELYNQFSISVNFSRFTIHHRNFYTDFYRIVNTYDIPHHSIEIEITESAFNDLSPAILAMLTQIKEDGFIISMDDFGSGYSSLNLLNTLSLDEIKIDRAFLNVENQNREQIIELIINIANVLNMKVICEGVETIEDVNMLHRLQCKMGQGYYFSKPISSTDFYNKFMG